jgi:hypothetical protein
MPAQDYESGRFAIRDLFASSRSTGVVYGVVDPGVTGLPYVTGVGDQPGESLGGQTGQLGCLGDGQLGRGDAGLSFRAIVARAQDNRRTRLPKAASPDILGGLGGQPVEVRSRTTKTGSRSRR